MLISGYTYIAHELITRGSLVECRFTVRKDSEPDINESIVINSIDINDVDLASLIEVRLNLINNIDLMEM